MSRRREDILCKACRKVSKHIIGIVRVGTEFATFNSDAGFGSRARYILWEIEVQHLNSGWVAVRGVGGLTGTNGKSLEGSDPI